VRSGPRLNLTLVPVMSAMLTMAMVVMPVMPT
jgi:hypothetical protein